MICQLVTKIPMLQTIITPIQASLVHNRRGTAVKPIIIMHTIRDKILSSISLHFIQQISLSIFQYKN
jgi:hypothetical protein